MPRAAWNAERIQAHCEAMAALEANVNALEGRLQQLDGSPAVPQCSPHVAKPPKEGSSAASNFEGEIELAKETLRAASQNAEAAAQESALKAPRPVLEHDFPAFSNQTPTWFHFKGHALEGLLVHTTLVDLAWLVDFADGKVMPDRKGIVPAWQGLPPEAEVKLEALRVSTYRVGLPVLVFSYGWGSQGHPDPTGDQLQGVLPLLRTLARYCDEECGPGCRWGVLMDFLALPQRGQTVWYSSESDDRTVWQRARFALGLGSINQWYGHMYATVLVINTPLPSTVQNQCPIDRRGWCIFEKRLSSLSKFVTCYLEIYPAFDVSEHADWDGAMMACIGQRPAPMNPDEFEQILTDGVKLEEASPGTGIKFTSGKDLTQVVLPQYRKGFERLMSEADNLIYAKLDWGLSEAKALARCWDYLKRAGIPAQLKQLFLDENKLDDDAAPYITASITALPLLKQVSVFSNNFSEKGLQELAEALTAVDNKQGASGKQPITFFCGLNPGYDSMNGRTFEAVEIRYHPAF